MGRPGRPKRGEKLVLIPVRVTREMANLIDRAMEIEGLKGQRDQYREELDKLQRLQHEDRSAATGIPETKELLRTVEKQLADRQRDRDRLEVIGQPEAEPRPAHPPALSHSVG